MGKPRIVLPTIILCLCTFAAYAQQTWQGNAAVARGGEFPSPGMYAASNAFSVNSTILVRNAQSGQSVKVKVTRRIPGTASVFMLLSEEAGKEIGLSGSQVIRVQARVLSIPEVDLSETLREQAYSSDPDLNPPLSVTDEQLQPRALPPSTVEKPPAAISRTAPPAQEPPAEIAEAAGPEQEPPAEPAVEGEAVAEPSVEQPAVTEEPPVEGIELTEPAVEPAAVEPEAEEQPAEKPVEPEEPAVEVVPEVAAEQPQAGEELTAEEKRLQEVAGRIPQKQLYMPPRQQEIFALAPEPAPSEEAEEGITAAEPVQPVEQAEAEAAAAAEEQPQAEEVEAEEQEVPEIVEEGPPRVSMIEPELEEEALEVPLPGPEAAEPEIPSPEGTRLPAPEEETLLSVAPEEPPTSEIEVEKIEEGEEQQGEEMAAEEKISEEEPVVEVAAAAAEETLELSQTLPPKTYFVQLAAYSNRTLAEKLAGDLNQSFSVTILPASSGGRRFYKVLVGPLNVDESGTLLYQFRSRGFKDAFIQYVE